MAELDELTRKAPLPSLLPVPGPSIPTDEEAEGQREKEPWGAGSGRVRAAGGWATDRGCEPAPRLSGGRPGDGGRAESHPPEASVSEDKASLLSESRLPRAWPSPTARRNP